MATLKGKPEACEYTYYRTITPISYVNKLWQEYVIRVWQKKNSGEIFDKKFDLNLGNG